MVIRAHFYKTLDPIGPILYHVLNFVTPPSHAPHSPPESVSCHGDYFLRVKKRLGDIWLNVIVNKAYDEWTVGPNYTEYNHSTTYPNIASL